MPENGGDHRICPEKKPRLFAQLLGSPRFFVGGYEADVRFRKDKAFLTYLCLNGGGPVARAQVVRLLWEDDDPQKGQTSFRQTLFRVRKALTAAGCECLTTNAVTVALNPGQFVTDLDEILTSLRSDQPTFERLSASECLSDRLGEGLDEVGESFFATLRAQRHIVHVRLVSALEDCLEKASESPLRTEAAQALINLDPSHELACRVLMSDRASRGDIAGAISIYNELWSVLSDEFDTEPSIETQSLLARVKLDRFTSDFIPSMSGLVKPGAAPAVTAAGNDYLDRGPVLVMGEFDIYGGDSQADGLAQAFRHDLLSRLVRFREWSVLDQMPSGRPKASTFLLSATISQAENGSRVALTLKQASSSRYVWSEYFDIEDGNLLDRQTELVGRIALALNVHVSADRLERIATIPHVTLDLYDRLLVGQRLNFAWDRSKSDKAADLFRDLIAEKPFFAPAYSALAQLINSRHIMFPGTFRNSAQLDFSDHLAKVALRLDPLDTRSYLCSGWSMALQNRFDEAYQAFRMAYDLNENDPWTSVSAPAGFCFCGDHERAAQLAERALNMGLVASPLQWSYNVVIWFTCGDDQKAIKAFERSNGGFFGVEAWHTAALVRAGRSDEARQQYAQLIENIQARWTGPEPPTSDEAERWITQCFPIGDPATKSRFLEALSVAGYRH
ncbi:BTAD domain-containing putative transcriptional regulator [Minwuia sp.]|uniref:BTAD domain-containing putative transcriptional regulator n=1 Tax=Minwuia sp. TaxID=2493630 RepID=UPI003A92C1B2